MDIKCSGCGDTVDRKGYCKLCKSKYDKERYLNNREEKLNYQKQYQIDHRNEILKYGKEYWVKNKERNRKYRKENSERYRQWKRDWIKMKNETDPIFKLSTRIRKLIPRAIKRNGYSKKSKTMEILGISYVEFKIYIESQFQEGMNWNNFGEWHIDHKTPISWAKTEEETIRLNHYSNLQPLWAYQNLSKGDKYSN